MASGTVSQDDTRRCDEEYLDRVARAAELVGKRMPTAPPVGIVLGSGLGGVVEDVDVAHCIDYEAIPRFPGSTAPGHAGRLIVGSLGSTPVVALQGRVHLYEGRDVAEVTFGVRVLHALGARSLVLTNAAGGLNPGLSVGDLVVIDSHIDFTGARFATFGGPAVAHDLRNRRPRMYTPGLVERALAVCRRENIVARRGSYVCVTGPNFETRAEYRMFRALGADVVGMSTVPEALVAAELGLNVLAISIVTNVCRPDRLEKTAGESVVSAAESAEWKLRAVLRRVITEDGAGPPD